MNSLLGDINNLDDEYKNLLNDIIKFGTVLVVLNLFMFLTNPSGNAFLGSNYIKFLVYILLGFVTYWLVISKLIKFD
tara:strand:- start:1205 stop:1435 length:231 start_codon:yes stop_codon:yes gene_type:complete